MYTIEYVSNEIINIFLYRMIDVPIGQANFVGSLMENIIHPFFTVDNIAQCQEDSVLDPDSSMLTLKDLDIARKLFYLYVYVLTYVCICMDV
jgi:hypothetical protein